MASPLAMMLAAAHPKAPEIAQTAIAPTNIGAIYDNAYKDQMLKYNADLSQRNAMWGGLASMAGTVGGAMIGGPMGAAAGAALGKGLAGAVSPSVPTGYQNYSTYGGGIGG